MMEIQQLPDENWRGSNGGSGNYEIRVKGHLGPQWREWFDGLTIRLEEDGNTLLTGAVVDQAALHGLLKKVRDLGLPLLSVNFVGADANSPTVHR